MRRPKRRHFSVLALSQTVLMAIVLASIVFPGLLPAGTAGSAFATSVVLSLPRLGRAPLFMLTLALGATTAAFAAGTGRLEDVVAAADRGAFLGTLLLSLSFVRTAATHSSLVRRSGAVLVAQPPGRRYAALLGGGQLLGIILNFGVLNLFGPMIMGQAHRLDAEERAHRQQMMVAVVRGFSLVMLWCPTTLAQALIVSAVPGLAWIDMLPFTFGAGLLAAGLGFALDRTQRRRQYSSPAGPAPSPAPLFGLVALIAVFLVVIVAVSQTVGQVLVLAVIPVAPAFSALWMAVAAWPRCGRRAPGLVARRIGRTAREFPTLANEIVLLGVAAYLGSIVASGLVVFASGLVGLVAAAPAEALALVTMLTVAAVAQVGLNPVIAVSVIGGVFAAAPVVPADPVLLGVALALGWTIAHGSSPFSAAALIAAKVTHLPAATIGLRLNGLYSLCLAALGSAVLLLLSQVL